MENGFYKTFEPVSIWFDNSKNVKKKILGCVAHTVVITIDMEIQG